MENDKLYYKERLKAARKKSSIALKNAFKIIDAFAEPSLDPAEFRKYDEVKSVLLKHYKA